MLTIQVTSIDTAFNNAIKDFIYKEKHKWKKDLKNVKALTSGYRPSYKFFDDLYEFSYNFLKKLTKKEWQRSCWWVNFYDKKHN